MPDIRLDVIPRTTDLLAAEQVLERISVRPPYFTLEDLALEGTYFEATARAEAPLYLEQGPMTAAEAGRHAALAGSCNIAMAQRDNKRRFYLAKEALCRYTVNSAPYGSPVNFKSSITLFDKRQAATHVLAEAGGHPLAEFDISYTILMETTFERLFKRKAHPTPEVASPYGKLLIESCDQGPDWAEQRLEVIPVHACPGHFQNFPALPVAVLMGQLSYLAGRIAGNPFRILRGDVRASDLGWAGEAISFRADRLSIDGNTQRYYCAATTGGREIGSMDLWLEAPCNTKSIN